MDYKRFPISELHHGKFSHSMEFQSWKVNFKTEVCAKTVNPQIRMHWITEVEKAQSIDELMTSQWILGRKDFADYEMLNVLMAPSLKKFLNWHVHFRKKSKCRGAACSKTRPILTRNADCTHDIRASSCNCGPMKQYKDSQTSSIYVSRMMMSKILTYDGTKHCYPQMKRSRIRSYKDHTSQNYRILFSYRLYWHCRIKKLSEIMGK